MPNRLYICVFVIPSAFMRSIASKSIFFRCLPNLPSLPLIGVKISLLKSMISLFLLFLSVVILRFKPRSFNAALTVSKLQFLPIPGELLAVHSLRMFHKFPRDKGLSDAGIILKN